MSGRLWRGHFTSNTEFGGGYRIGGTAQRQGVGCKKRIRLIVRKTGRLIRELWSNSDGSFSFDYSAYQYQGYIVMELDDESYDPWFDPACADRVTPEMMS